MLTWSQLGIHRKPCALLDVDDYYGKLVEFLDHAVARRFITPQHRAMLIVEHDAETVLDRLASTPLPDVSKWMDRKPA